MRPWLKRSSAGPAWCWPPSRVRASLTKVRSIGWTATARDAPAKDSECRAAGATPDCLLLATLLRAAHVDPLIMQKLEHADLDLCVSRAIRVDGGRWHVTCILALLE